MILYLNESLISVALLEKLLEDKNNAVILLYILLFLGLCFFRLQMRRCVPASVHGAEAEL